MKRWFVVETHLRAERKAEAHLRNQGFTTFLPVFQRRRSHARRVDVTLAPLFPRYMFVELDLDMSRWRAILSTIGVVRLVCQGERPAPVPAGVIEEIQGRTDKAGYVRMSEQRPFRPGERLRILQGALADQIGQFQRMTAEDRVILLLDLLGRKMEVPVPAGAVSPTA